MKTSKIVTLLSFTGLAALLVGLGIHINRQMTLIYNYCFKIVNLKINQIAITNVDIDLTLKVRNQSDINLLIKQYQFHIYIDQYYVCDVLYQEDIAYNANTTSMIPVKIKFSPQALTDSMNIGEALALVSKFLTNRDAIVIKMQGSATVKHSLIKLTIPLNISMTIKEIMATDPNALPCQV